MSFALFTLIMLYLASSFYVGRKKARTLSQQARIHSREDSHGTRLLIYGFVSIFIVYLIWSVGEPFLVETIILDELSAHLTAEKADYVYQSYLNGIETEKTALVEHVVGRLSQISKLFLMLLTTIVCFGVVYWAYKSITPDLKARHFVEKFIFLVLILCSSIAILTTIGIVLSLLFESLRFFNIVSPIDFIFGTHWSPQTAIRTDQVASQGSFGILPLLSGTFLITCVAMVVAVPTGLFAAIYMSDYASNKMRGFCKPVLEILAGIPTVVYGFFAALVVAPLIREWGEAVGLTVASESAVAAGLVMGIMIIPFVSSLSDDVINAVPQSLRDGSYALGATKSETIKNVILPAALPGIVASVLLAVSRAIGETMIVVMAAGLRANLTANPLEDVTTVTVQIVALLTGDQEFDSAKTLSAFALGLVLFLLTLFMNIIALRVVKKYREKYE